MDAFRECFLNAFWESVWSLLGALGHFLETSGELWRLWDSLRDVCLVVSFVGPWMPFGVLFDRFLEFLLTFVGALGAPFGGSKSMAGAMF